MPTLLNPGPLLDLHMTSFATIPNGVQLLADGNMEAAGVAAWIPGTAGVVPSKETVPAPHSGTQYLRLNCNGLGNPFVYQSVCTIGNTYRVTGWARGDGVVTQPNVWQGRDLFTGTISTAWQYFDVTFVAAASTQIRFYGRNVAGNFADYDDITVELCPASTRNLGSLGGVALLGDGVTAATMPTQLSPHGMSFDGGDYLTVANNGVYDFRVGGVDQPFSVEALWLGTEPGAPRFRPIFGKGDIVSVQGGWIFYTSLSTCFRLGDSAGNFFGIAASAAESTVLYKNLSHVVGTYTGSGLVSGTKLYINARQVGTEGTTGIYTGQPNDFRPVYIGRGKVGATTSYGLGVGYNFAIYNWALTPSQVSQQYRKRMAMLQCR